MSNDIFTFRQFEVRQDRCAMKVGTDGVLLGAWANGGRRVLDIGAGTALISLIMAQRFPDASVMGVEIDADAATQARENVAASPFAGRVAICEASIQTFAAADGFDAIVSNPPFFSNSLRNPDSQRAAARHTDTLSYRDLFAAVARMLLPGGEFSAVIPFDCLASFTAEAYMAGLAMSRRCAIKTTPRKQPRRYLVAFHHAEDNIAATTSMQCIMNADGSRSEWYQNLTSELYL